MDGVLPAKLRLALKAATHGAHERVDAAFSGFDLTDRDGYAAFLIAHSAVLPGCEARLAASDVAALLPDWPARSRSAALFADLAALGIGAAPAAAGPPLDAPQAFGMLYVLEGSRLGGAVLARRVLANPDAECRTATRYLRHGEGSGLWPRFIAAFEASPVVAANIERVAASALETFELFLAAATVDTASRAR